MALASGLRRGRPIRSAPHRASARQGPFRTRPCIRRPGPGRPRSSQAPRSPSSRVSSKVETIFPLCPDCQDRFRPSHESRRPMRLSQQLQERRRRFQPTRFQLRVPVALAGSRRASRDRRSFSSRADLCRPSFQVVGEVGACGGADRARGAPCRPISSPLGHSCWVRTIQVAGGNLFEFAGEGLDRRRPLARPPPGSPRCGRRRRGRLSLRRNRRADRIRRSLGRFDEWCDGGRHRRNRSAVICPTTIGWRIERARAVACGTIRTVGLRSRGGTRGRSVVRRGIWADGRGEPLPCTGHTGRRRDFARRWLCWSAARQSDQSRLLSSDGFVRARRG